MQSLRCVPAFLILCLYTVPRHKLIVFISVSQPPRHFAAQNATPPQEGNCILIPLLWRGARQDGVVNKNITLLPLRSIQWVQRGRRPPHHADSVVGTHRIWCTPRNQCGADDTELPGLQKPDNAEHKSSNHCIFRQSDTG